MGSYFSSSTGFVAPAGRITMTRAGSSGSQRARRWGSTSRRGLSSTPASETCHDPEARAVIDVDGNELDSMMCDMSGPENCANNVAEEELSMPRDVSTFASLFANPISFTNFAMSVLNSGGSGVLPDDVRFCLLSTVQYLEETARAASLERTAALEAYQAEISQVMAECEKRVAEIQVTSEARMKELSTQLETACKEHSEASCQIYGVQTALTTSQAELQYCKERAHDLQAEVKEKTVQIEKSNAKVVELERTQRFSQAATDASAKEVQRLKTTVTEKEKAVEEMKSEINLLTAKCTKVEAQIAQLEQKAAQESLNSGSYADDRANPNMLHDVACKCVDKATDALTKILHESSISSSRDSKPELNLFLRGISPAKREEFARPLHVKYVWSFRICSVMFRGFEHCYFAIDGGQLTSPLDAKVYALKCLESFQVKKAIPSLELYKKCNMFRAFCAIKYAEMFPPAILKAAQFSFHRDSNIRFDDSGRFSGDATIFNSFLDVAKAVWLLHELAFAFDPPVTILRMACGEAFDKGFHESVVHDEDTVGGSSKVVLMIRPAFRVRNTVIRSRVFRANV